MNKRYAVYARQSIDKSDSISIETQIERCLFEVGDAPHQIYADRGYSGKNTDRPQFQQMLEAVRRGEINCVVCYKLDRCSRSILDFTQLMNLFQQHDVAFISCTEKFDTATPMGRAMLNICIVFAQLERETIQQRITDAYHSRCKKGYFMGGRVPFGFSLKPYLLEGKKTSCYQTVQDEADILKLIYSIYQTPDFSLSDVVLRLKELKMLNPRRSDGLWVRPHIGRLIKNPIYVMADERIYDYFTQLNTVPDNPREDYVGQNGCYLYRIGEEQHLVLAPHNGIISSEVWLRCQKRKINTNRANRKQIPKSWLTGKLKCQICGRAVATRQTTAKNNRLYGYFLCSASRGRDHSCKGFKPFPLKTTEEIIGTAIREHIRYLSEQEGRCTATAPTVLLRELFSKIQDNSYPIEQLKQEIQNLSTELHLQFTKRPPQSKGNQEQWEYLLARFDRWHELPTDKKMQVADLFIESVMLSDHRITIGWRV